MSRRQFLPVDHCSESLSLPQAGWFSQAHRRNIALRFLGYRSIAEFEDDPMDRSGIHQTGLVRRICAAASLIPVSRWTASGTCG
jgi:hypothetical protein